MVKKQLKLSRYLKHRSPKTKYQNSRNRSVIKYSFLKSKRSKTTKQKQKSTKEKSTRKYKKTKIKKLKGKRLSKTDLKRRFKSYLKIKSKSKLLSSKSKRSTLSVKPRRSKGQLKSSRLKNGDSLLLIDSKSNKVFTVPKAILIKSSFQMEPNCTLDAAMLDKYSSLLSKYKEDYWLKMNSPKVAEDVDENKLRKLMDYQPTTLPFSVDNWDSTSLDEKINLLKSISNIEKKKSKLSEAFEGKSKERILNPELSDDKMETKRLDRIVLKEDESVKMEPEIKESTQKEREKCESEKSEPKKSEPMKSEPEKSEPKKSEPEKSEPEKSEPEKSEPKKSESELKEPEKGEPEKSKSSKKSSSSNRSKTNSNDFENRRQSKKRIEKSKSVLKELVKSTVSFKLEFEKNFPSEIKSVKSESSKSKPKLFKRSLTKSLIVLSKKMLKKGKSKTKYAKQLLMNKTINEQADTKQCAAADKNNMDARFSTKEIKILSKKFKFKF